MDENMKDKRDEGGEEIIPEGISDEILEEVIWEEALPEEDKKEKSFGKEIFEWLQAIVVAVVIAMFLRTFIFTLVNVSGASMQPTLQHEDKLIVWRLGYTPEKGDVIIFKPKGHEDTPYVKRVIATEGQTIDIKYNEAKGHCDVYVDGQMLTEDYIKAEIDINHMGTMKFPATVPENCVFAMGDNRNNSKDSRFKDVGMVTEDSIIGHAVFRLWPVQEIGLID